MTDPSPRPPRTERASEALPPEPAPPAPRRERPKKPGPLPTFLAAVAVFAVAFEFLAFQLSAGRDPALGPGTAASAPIAKSRPAKKLVITKVIPAGNGAGAAPAYSSSGTAAAPAPVVTASS